MRALGIDVGVRKGLDLVLLDGSLEPAATYRRVLLEDVRLLIDEANADVVAIDSPPGWAEKGRSRATEREIRLLGIQSYGTPTADQGMDHPFYEWMRVGFEVFRFAGLAGFPRYRGGPARGTAIEVFPHATTVVLSGCLPPAGVAKHTWRASVLAGHGVQPASLAGPDQVDAALAALTGLLALRGELIAQGDSNEGVIVLPTRTLPERPYPRCDPPGVGSASGREGPRRNTSCDRSGPERPTDEARGRGEETRMRAAAGDAMRFETMAVHVGQDPEPEFGSVNVPIYQTSTYAQEGVGKPKRYDYARGGNPTREALETVLAALEGGAHGLCFGSGMAAETTVLLARLRPGDHVVLGDDVYGGTYRLLARVLADWGVAFDTVDLTDGQAVRRALRQKTRVVWVESPTNPTLRVVDIADLAEAAHQAGAWCVVDNTFASPYLQQPLSLGADAVVHSVTKYLGGHSDLVGGALMLNDGEAAERLRFLQNAVGAVPGPMDCYLALRGVKTLAIRMEAHCRGGRRVAEFLAAHDRVAAVHFPGLPQHPQHELAKRQMRGFGGMVSFEMGSAEEAIRVAESTRLFFLGESLGGVESLIEVPGPMTHASVAGSPLEVSPTLIRLSVGIEHPDDLVEDLSRALDSA